MEYSEIIAIRAVVILKADRVYAECARQLALRVFPAARVDIATSIAGAAPLLADRSVDLFVTGIGVSIDGDVLDLLSNYVRPPHAGRRVLVISARRDYRELAALRALGINGVFDSATEPAEQLVFAMKLVATGGRYWSSTIVDQMNRAGLNVNPIVRILTTFEQLALSIIGDGSDDDEAARELGVSPATVSTVRRDLHRKLGVQHRGELVRVAAQNGFVRFTPDGVVRPGYSILAAAYHARRPHRSDSLSHATKITPTARRHHGSTAVMVAVT
jgi:DNA-binding NarL/FixJ family response regulator